MGGGGGPLVGWCPGATRGVVVRQEAGVSAADDAAFGGLGAASVRRADRGHSPCRCSGSHRRPSWLTVGSTALAPVAARQPVAPHGFLRGGVGPVDHSGLRRGVAIPLGVMASAKRAAHVAAVAVVVQCGWTVHRAWPTTFGRSTRWRLVAGACP